MRDLSSGIWLLQLIISLIVGALGAVIGAVFAAFRVDKRISLLEQKFDLLIDGAGGVIKKLANIEAAILARRNPPVAL